MSINIKLLPQHIAVTEINEAKWRKIYINLLRFKPLTHTGMEGLLCYDLQGVFGSQ